MLDRLVAYLQGQITNQAIEAEILTDADDGEDSVGIKRDRLLKRAQGEYVSFIDDDDSVVFDYIKTINEHIRGIDCMGLMGILRTDGKREELFIHSKKYTAWERRGRIYVRPPNHLNPIKREIALQIGFTDKRHGEDHEYSIKLQQSKLIKSEVMVERVMYIYNYKTKK